MKIKVKHISNNDLYLDQDLIINSGSIYGYHFFDNIDYCDWCHSAYYPPYRCSCAYDDYDYDFNYESHNGFCYPRYTKEEKREILIDIILDGYEEFDYFNQYNTIGDFMDIKNG